MVQKSISVGVFFYQSAVFFLSFTLNGA